MFALLLLLAAAPAHALGKTSLDLELDPYYTALGWTVPFEKNSDEVDVEKGELSTYGEMLTRSLVPRFMVIEASVNPLPLAGAAVRDRSESAYQKLQLGDSFNLLESATAGFEEPYALSIFLGKVIDFSKGTKTLGRAQKGYVGYLISGGNYHIMNLLVIPDNWVEAEWKVKGDVHSQGKNMSWSFRGGAKLHDNPDIQNTLYVGIRRDRTDFLPMQWAWLLSTSFEYRLDVSARNFQPLSHFVLLEKNFPARGKKWTFSMGVGYLWIGQDKYSGELALRRRNVDSQFLFRPNLKF